MSDFGGKRTLRASRPQRYASPVATNFLIDGMLSGTGVRDAISGGYVEPEAIGLSDSLAAELVAWQQRYEDAHFADFPEDVVAELDGEGLVLASRADAELRGRNVGYFSHESTKRLA